MWFWTLENIPLSSIWVKKTLRIDHMRSYAHLLYLDIWKGNSYSDIQSSQLEFQVLLKWMWVVGQWFDIEVIVPKYWVTLVFVFISWLFRKSLFSKSEIVDKLFLFSCSQLWWHWKWVCISNDFQISFHTHGRESGDIANTGHLWGYNDTPTTEHTWQILSLLHKYLTSPN